MESNSYSRFLVYRTGYRRGDPISGLQRPFVGIFPFPVILEVASIDLNAEEHKS